MSNIFKSKSPKYKVKQTSNYSPANKKQKIKEKNNLQNADSQQTPQEN